MKVILLQDVAKIGRKGAVVEVPDGQAQNMLIPRKMAKPATAENLKAAVHVAASRETEAAKAEEKFFAIRKALAGQAVVLPGRKNDNGHLFAAIKPEEITEAANKAGIPLEKEMVIIETPIKTTGEHRAVLARGTHHADFIIKVEG